MGYFDDLDFLDGEVRPGCRAQVDQCFAGTWSVEFLLAGRMSYGRDHGPRVVLDRPTAFWHSPRHSYQYGALDERGWDHHWVLLKGERARRMIEEGLAPLAGEDRLPVPEPLVLAREFRELVALVQAHDRRRHPEAAARLERIVALLVEWAAGKAQASAPWQDEVDDLAGRMRGAPCGNFDIPAEAARVGLSYSRYRRVFQARTGLAPYEFLLEARLRHAARVLRETGRQVKAVGAEIGYPDPAEFSKLFKRRIGLSPRQCRAFAVRGGDGGAGEGA